jgi:bacterioferritin (cytochrome b1)
MTKDAFWFKHDSNAHRDPKLVSLIIKMGYEGYGLYWALVEKMREEATYKLPLDFDMLAYDLRSDAEKIKRIVNEFGLFSVKKDCFFSRSLKKRMKDWEESKQKRIDAGRKGGLAKAQQSSSNAKAMPQQSSSNALARRGEKRREEETKEKKKYNPKQAVSGLGWIDDKLWSEWIDHKRKVKASVSERAIKANIKELEGFGKNIANRVIAQSLDCGWKGLFALKDNAPASTAKPDVSRANLRKQLDQLEADLIADYHSIEAYPDMVEYLKITGEADSEARALVDEAIKAGLALGPSVKQWMETKE